MTNLYNQNFLETPDPVTGLQRRTGQNFIDHKQTLHERLTLEHAIDPNDTSPQTNHGIHREGSARAYVTAVGETKPTVRPTGQDKGGVEITALALDDSDEGRLLIHENTALWYWKDATDGWIQIDTTPVGMIQMWPSPITTPGSLWLKCDGDDSLSVTDYPTLFARLGTTYGGDGILTFGIPNLQGITTVGAGQQTDYLATGRDKGILGSSPGDYREDQIQSLVGGVKFRSMYSDTNIARDFSGIFEVDNSTGTTAQRIDNTSNDKQTRGFKLNLTAAGVRNGDETIPSALAIDYYIKAL